ncbi:MAG: M20/M25/M40 family metallo-hydrolase, partial [Firmicutes bacterium]|nr:M20/M25/M40 family metallo-hydrolase [Bacillota bacterium]
MNAKQQLIVKSVDAHRQEILDAERWIWQHPQVGYTEWQANEYLIERFEAMGYKLVRADQDPNYGKIPGFYTDVDTGKPGPCLAIMGELDALDIANHPESVNGMTHCCGHHAQASGMLGVAAALKEPGALDGLSGKIRLMLVPAEEMIQLEYREGLRKQGIIKYNGGKPEFMYRGYFDGVDMAILVHGTNSGDDIDFSGTKGSNGCIAKVITYRGKSSHAGGAPHLGINAQYAAMLGLQACNDLRETLQEKDSIRFHPIMKGVNCAVNIIPDEMKIESYVRGATMEGMLRENKKFNRALAGGAVSMGARVEVCDRPGYAPRYYYLPMLEEFEKACIDLVGAERVKIDANSWQTGSSDVGDVTMIMPAVQVYAGGATGTGHGTDYYVKDANRLCVNAAKVQLFMVDRMLGDGAAKAKEIIAGYKPPYPSKEAYFEAISEADMEKELVEYGEDGTITVS